MKLKTTTINDFHYDSNEKRLYVVGNLVKPIYLGDVMKNRDGTYFFDLSDLEGENLYNLLDAGFFMHDSKLFDSIKDIDTLHKNRKKSSDVARAAISVFKRWYKGLDWLYRYYKY